MSFHSQLKLPNLTNSYSGSHHRTTSSTSSGNADSGDGGFKGGLLDGIGEEIESDYDDAADGENEYVFEGGSSGEDEPLAEHSNPLHPQQQQQHHRTASNNKHAVDEQRYRQQLLASVTNTQATKHQPGLLSESSDDDADHNDSIADLKRIREAEHNVPTVFTGLMKAGGQPTSASVNAAKPSVTAAAAAHNQQADAQQSKQVTNTATPTGSAAAAYHSMMSSSHAANDAKLPANGSITHLAPAETSPSIVKVASQPLGSDEDDEFPAYADDDEYADDFVHASNSAKHGVSHHNITADIDLDAIAEVNDSKSFLANVKSPVQQQQQASAHAEKHHQRLYSTSNSQHPSDAFDQSPDASDGLNLSLQPTQEEMRAMSADEDIDDHEFVSPTKILQEESLLMGNGMMGSQPSSLHNTTNFSTIIGNQSVVLHEMSHIQHQSTVNDSKIQHIAMDESHIQNGATNQYSQQSTPAKSPAQQKQANGHQAAQQGFKDLPQFPSPTDMFASKSGPLGLQFGHTQRPVFYSPNMSNIHGEDHNESALEDDDDSNLPPRSHNQTNDDFVAAHEIVSPIRNEPPPKLLASDDEFTDEFGAATDDHSLHDEGLIDMNETQQHDQHAQRSVNQSMLSTPPSQPGSRAVSHNATADTLLTPPFAVSDVASITVNHSTLNAHLHTPNAQQPRPTSVAPSPAIINEQLTVSQAKRKLTAKGFDPEQMLTTVISPHEPNNSDEQPAFLRDAIAETQPADVEEEIVEEEMDAGVDSSNVSVRRDNLSSAKSPVGGQHLGVTATVDDELAQIAQRQQRLSSGGLDNSTRHTVPASFDPAELAIALQPRPSVSLFNATASHSQFESANTTKHIDFEEEKTSNMPAHRPSAAVLPASLRSVPTHLSPTASIPRSRAQPANFTTTTSGDQKLRTLTSKELRKLHRFVHFRVSVDALAQQLNTDEPSAIQQYIQQLSDKYVSTVFAQHAPIYQSVKASSAATTATMAFTLMLIFNLPAQHQQQNTLLLDDQWQSDFVLQFEPVLSDVHYIELKPPQMAQTS